MALLKSCPGEIDLCLYLGDSNVIEVEFLADGMPVDTTGWVLTSQIRATALDPVVVVEGVFTEVDATLGQYLLGFDGEAARATVGEAESWSGVWDLQSESTAGVQTHAAGVATFTQDVTKAVTP